MTSSGGGGKNALGRVGGVLAVGGAAAHRAAVRSPRIGEPAPVRRCSRLQEFPLGERGESSFRDCAVRLGLSESALKSAVHRMRQRYRDLVREEVTHTVDDPAEVEEEIRHLIAVVSG